MTRPSRMMRPLRRQTGLVLLLLVGMLGLGATYMMMRAFNEATLNSPHQSRNALVLEEAKAALLMYVSTNVAAEAYPGKLPCPENTAAIGFPGEGNAQPFCSLPAIGRLPWKTLGYGKAPLDADGEQLWYAVSVGFNRASGTAPLTINSHTPAALTVDGTTARAVALIIAPGRALGGQTRPAVSSVSPPVAANYLDDENATPLDYKFITYKTSTVIGNISAVFNDQVAIVSHQDLFGVVEPAVAKRLKDSFATVVSGNHPLTTIYSSTIVRAAGSGPLFPYAVPFGNPNTSTFQGIVGTTAGLLPVNFSSNSATVYCNPVTDGPRCNPTFVHWISLQNFARVSGSMTVYSIPAPVCAVGLSDITCTIFTATGSATCSSLIYTVTATASNVAMALRQLDAGAPSLTGFCSSGYSVSSVVINTDGSSTITYTGAVNNTGSTVAAGTCPETGTTCQKRAFSIPIRIFQDHPIVNSADPDYGWFTRNDWHKLTYYAIAPGFAASGTGDCTAPNCLTVTNLSTTPNDNKRALLILAGRPIMLQTRPSSDLSKYLESDNLAPPGGNAYVTLKPSLQFNDRVVVVDSN